MSCHFWLAPPRAIPLDEGAVAVAGAGDIHAAAINLDAAVTGQGPASRGRDAVVAADAEDDRAFLVHRVVTRGRTRCSRRLGGRTARCHRGWPTGSARPKSLSRTRPPASRRSRCRPAVIAVPRCSHVHAVRPRGRRPSPASPARLARFNSFPVKSHQKPVQKYSAVTRFAAS